MISQSNHMMSVAKRWCWSRNGHTQYWLNTSVTTKIILKSSTGLFTLHDESTWIWWIRIGMWLLSCYYVKPLLHIQRSLDLKIAEIPRLCYIDTNLISIQNQGSEITSAWARSWHLSCNTSIHEQRWLNTLCFFLSESLKTRSANPKKTVVSDGTLFENWSYYRLRMTKWVNILIKWQDLIKTWESVLRVSHTDAPMRWTRILRTSDTDY